ncbi:MAG: aminotransferase class I/II-fold pyridoxal phosphate-dependent enzyme [Bacteroidia bacterium]|nr:aminotransferase class I/II-fold pyridoxal phosphate-dependent enzyme [Bacteroidia bacterium]
MSFSIIGNSISESVTLKLNETAAILRAKGEPVIHLGGGEPKSKAPLDAIQAAAGLLSSGDIRYTPADGTPALKKAIIRFTVDTYGRLVEPENIIASGGAKQALMVALQAILDPQDEVIFPAPYWVSYPEMVKLCGAVPVPVHPEDGTFYPRMQDIEQVCGTYTKAIIINSPNNPTGVIYSEEFIAELVEFSQKRGIYLIMDDIYNRLAFGDRKPANCYKYLKGSINDSKLIVINGVSKQYAMTGFRIGWAVANKKLIEVMTNIQAHQTSGPSVVLQAAAAGAINGIQSCVTSLCTTLENNTKVMMEQLNAFTGLHAVKPDGTFYCFVDFSNYNKNSTELAYHLLDKVLVITVPGIEFGLDGFLRLSTCGSIKDITEGIERIKWAIDPNSPNELFIGERKLVRDWL